MTAQIILSKLNEDPRWLSIWKTRGPVVPYVVPFKGSRECHKSAAPGEGRFLKYRMQRHPPKQRPQVDAAMR